VTERASGNWTLPTHLLTCSIRREGWSLKDMADLEDAVDYTADPFEHSSIFPEAGAGTIFGN